MPPKADPADLTAAEASRALEAGTLTSEALVRACLDRIAASDADVKAWTYVDADQAIRAARELDKQPRRSALHGVPVGVKDMIDTKDMPTQHNSPIYQGHRPGQDAAVVATLRAAGAVILGKTDTHEFAAGGRLPASRNPHNTAHTPGGSSSGSAAAVGARHVPLALGTQTAGSTIRPASFCGVAAMKPTYGTISREGAKTYSISLDTIGLFGRSAGDLGLMIDVLAVDRKPWKPLRSLKGARFAFCQTPYFSEAAPESRAAMDSAVTALVGAGAVVETLTLPAEFSRANELQNIIMRGEGRAAFLAEYRNSFGLLSQEFRDRVEDRDRISPEKLRDAMDEMARLRPVFDRLAEGYAAVLTPAALGEAPPISANTTGNPMFNRMWSALHVPCVALPWTKGPRGLPVGIQLVAPRYRDAALVGVAAAVERLARG